MGETLKELTGGFLRQVRALENPESGTKIKGRARVSPTADPSFGGRRTLRRVRVGGGETGGGALRLAGLESRVSLPGLTEGRNLSPPPRERVGAPRPLSLVGFLVAVGREGAMHIWWQGSSPGVYPRGDSRGWDLTPL